MRQGKETDEGRYRVTCYASECSLQSYTTKFPFMKKATTYNASHNGNLLKKNTNRETAGVLKTGPKK